MARQCAAVSIRSPVDECTTEPVQVCTIVPPKKIGPTRGSGFTGPATGILSGLSASCARMLVVRTGPAGWPHGASSSTSPKTIAKIRIGPHHDGSAAVQGAFSAAIRVADSL